MEAKARAPSPEGLPDLEKKRERVWQWPYQRHTDITWANEKYYLIWQQRKKMMPLTPRYLCHSVGGTVMWTPTGASIMGDRSSVSQLLEGKRFSSGRQLGSVSRNRKHFHHIVQPSHPLLFIQRGCTLTSTWNPAYTHFVTASLIVIKLKKDSYLQVHDC